MRVQVIFHVALSVIGLQNAGQFPVTSHVEPSVGGQHDQPGAAVPPAYFVLNNKCCQLCEKEKVLWVHHSQW